MTMESSHALRTRHGDVDLVCVRTFITLGSGDRRQRLVSAGFPPPVRKGCTSHLAALGHHEHVCVALGGVRKIPVGCR